MSQQGLFESDNDLQIVASFDKEAGLDSIPREDGVLLTILAPCCPTAVLTSSSSNCCSFVQDSAAHRTDPYRNEQGEPLVAWMHLIPIKDRRARSCRDRVEDEGIAEHSAGRLAEMFIEYEENKATCHEGWYPAHQVEQHPVVLIP